MLEKRGQVVAIRLHAAAILDGDFFFVSGSSWYARLIRANTFSRFSHVGLAIWAPLAGMRRLCIFEAIGSGVRLFPMDRYLAECQHLREKVYWFSTSPEIDHEKLLRYAAWQWGKPYASAWQMVFSFGWLTRFVRHLIGSRDRDLDVDRFFCSELLASALQYAGVTTPLPAAMSPGQLASAPFLKNNGELTL